MECSWGFMFKNNIIEGCYSSPIDETGGSKQLLPYNYFIAEGMQSEILNNRIGHRSYDIEINSLCSNNFIGSDCHGITLKKGSSGNVWKNGSTASIHSYSYSLLTLENNTFEENSSAGIRVFPYFDNTIIRNCRIGKNVGGNWILEKETAESSAEKYFAYNSAGNMDVYIGYRGMPGNTNPVKCILSANGENASWESMSSMVRSYKNVEFFDGFVNALDTYSEASLVLPVSGVYFLEDKGIFGGLRDGVYYNNWNDIRYPAADFNSYEDGISPRADRIFEDITTGKRYVWNSVNSSLEEYTES